MRSAPTTRTVWLPKRLLAEAEAWANAWAPLEVGGILAGYIQGAEGVVTHLVGPGTRATHTRASFLPDHTYHVDEVARIYRETEGVSTYLGDWHTHPDGLPRLSPTDRKTLRNIATDPEARCPEPLMMILAGSRARWEPVIFQQPTKRQVWSKEIHSFLRLW
jgi:integrative and conjugative element protein (TIGR02256 family)